jgi:hypothetical protein
MKRTTVLVTEQPFLDAAPEPPADRPGSMANAARQAVLRRVAPALKHDMVVHLQALAMMAEMLNARIERGSVNSADLQSNISKLNRLAREAVQGCVKVTSWIDAGDEESVPLLQGVQETVGLLTASFNFRGFAIANEVGPTGFEVGRNAVRNLLAASLITLADSAAESCEFVVDAIVLGAQAVVTVRSRPRLDESLAPIPPARVTGPRTVLDWDEVLALAAVEKAELERHGDSILLKLPRALVTSPLQMAPV